MGVRMATLPTMYNPPPSFSTTARLMRVVFIFLFSSKSVLLYFLLDSRVVVKKPMLRTVTPTPAIIPMHKLCQLECHGPEPYVEQWVAHTVD